MTDYEKAKAECKEAFRKENSEIITRSEERAIDYAFLEAYRYGRLVAMEEAKANPDLFRDPTKMMRTQAAIAAMQGILSYESFDIILDGKGRRRTPQSIASTALEIADALLAELDKM